MKFSHTTIQRTSALITNKIECLINNFQNIILSADGLVVTPSDISMNNKPLISYMKHLLKEHPNLTAFMIGRADGTFLLMYNVHLSQLPTFISKPAVKLPSNAIYAIGFVDRSIPTPTQTIYYLDENFQHVAMENVTPVLFDPRTRPWYIGTQKTGKLFWTDIYQFDSFNEPGVAVSKPIFDSKGAMIGAFGANLSLTSYSEFLNKQKIGITGRALVLDAETGKVLLPVGAQGKPSPPLSESVIAKAFQEYKKDKTTDFTFTENDVDYLASLQPFPIGVENQWLITVIVPVSDFFGQVLATEKKVVLISIGICLLAGVLVVIFSQRISKPITILAKEIDKIQNLDLDSTIRVNSNIREISTMDSSIASMRLAIRSFAKYVPKEIVRQLIKQGKEIVLGGEKKELTILFSDIVGFTPIAERISVDLLMPLLAEYFDEMSRVILENQGTIDKYIGDSIMAFWGAPTEINQPALHACDSALYSLALLKKINAKRSSNEQPQFITKFGIDTGMVIVGNIGTNERMNYTAIGDPVNAAARLQVINSTYHTSIIISENVYTQVKNHFLTRPLDIVNVKGKEKKIKIYELIAKNTPDTLIGATETQKALCRGFTAAYNEYELGNKEISLNLFKELSLAFPNDEPTKFFMKKIKETDA
jgi:adenylate cyclase